MKKTEEQSQKILDFMLEEAYKPLTFEELSYILDIPKNQKTELNQILDYLLEEGKIIKTKKNRYGETTKMGLIAGKITTSEKGFGFLLPFDKSHKDVFIAPNDLSSAMNGDIVLVKVSTSTDTGDKRQEGVVERVVKRNTLTLVGTYEYSDNFGFVVPDEKKINKDIFIPNKLSLNAQANEKVVVRITKYPDGRRNAEGEVIERLGFMNQPGVDVLSIIRRFAIKEEFDEETIIDAEKIGEITTQEINERRDFRDENVITIDGDDARDLDDAIHIKKLENGNFLLGVHIADVSYYVRKGSHIDDEATLRATSIYLSDRVIPMLPTQLSNGICSLNPHENRLTFSVLMEIDASGNVVSKELVKAVIASKERMTYKNVTKLLQHEDKELEDRYSHILPDLALMLELAICLRKKRDKRGAIDFDFPETKAVLDETGKPIDILKYEVTVSNRIIEEFMLVCNETVAEYAFWAGIPFVYRVHEQPNPDKMFELSKFVYNFDIILKTDSTVHPSALQKVMNKIKGTDEERIISTAMLRSMMKARYNSTNDGHFGLAAKYYAHFTSPIRRYPDLAIHRILTKVLEGGLNENAMTYFNSYAKDVSEHSSEQEVVATEAEREVTKLKIAQYMAMHIGEEFTGTISSVTSFGMFVELENSVEGLIRMNSLDDDYYQYDDKGYRLIGEHSRKIYKIGDKIDIIVVGADEDSRQIDFVPANSSPQTLAQAKAAKTKRPKPDAKGKREYSKDDSANKLKSKKPKDYATKKFVKGTQKGKTKKK